MTGMAMILVGRMWTVRCWIRRSIEHFYRGLIDHTSRCMGKGGAQSNVNGQVQEIFERKSASQPLYKQLFQRRDHSKNPQLEKRTGTQNRAQIHKNAHSVVSSPICYIYNITTINKPHGTLNKRNRTVVISRGRTFKIGPSTDPDQGNPKLQDGILSQRNKK